MVLAQRTVEHPETAFGAVVARQLSVWPFGARTLRLFVLVDPSLSDSALRPGLVRAMQQGYFGSDGCSQTRAVREAALAAHYVLRHHNRDVLPLNQVSAASAVAAVRGDVAFVALAGDAAAFAWRGGSLTGQCGILRVPRPLGLDQDPHVTLWSAPLQSGDRLILVCGATWSADSARAIQEVLGQSVDSSEAAEERLSVALGGSKPAGVLIVDPLGEPRRQRHLRLVSVREHGRGPELPAASRQLEPPGHRLRLPGRRWLASLLALGLLGAAALAAVSPASKASLPSTTDQVASLTAAADQTSDLSTAHALVANALRLAQQAASTAPAQYGDLVAQVSHQLDTIDRVSPVNPAMAVRLGPSGGNVVDLAVGDDAIYTLDVVEASVRAFPLDARDQQPTPETLLVRAGMPLASGSRQLATPVAIEYLSEGLAIVDQSRSVVQVGHDGALTARQVPSSATWRELGALGASQDGHLYVLDSGSRRLFEYPPLSQRVVDPPRLLLDGASTPTLSLEHAAQIVGQQDQVFLRLDDGSLLRFDSQGAESIVAIQPPDGQLLAVSGVAADRNNGLYVADPAHARVLHTTADGRLLRQFRDPALAGLRQIQSSLDGRRVYGLVASGVLVFDVPAEETN